MCFKVKIILKNLFLIIIIKDSIFQIYSTQTTDNKAANIKQQLRYVAVSRATDTVTVIANDANVKKEDTPLNHVKETSQDNSTINQQESRSSIGIINITQNASGRLGSLDKADEDAYKKQKKP